MLANVAWDKSLDLSFLTHEIRVVFLSYRVVNGRKCSVVCDSVLGNIDSEMG